MHIFFVNTFITFTAFMIMAPVEEPKNQFINRASAVKGYILFVSRRVLREIHQKKFLI